MHYLRNLFLLFCLSGLLACQEDTIDLVTFAQLTGTVTNEAGNPVAGAQVSTVPPTSVALTDSSGTFQLAGLPTGEYTITTQKTGYRNESFKLSLLSEQIATLAFALVPAKANRGSITGTIRDAITQNPVNGASIETHPATTGLLTSADGTFQLDSLTTGDYRIEIKRLGYQPDTVTVAVSEGKPTKVELLLIPQAVTGFSYPTSPVPAQGEEEQPTELTLRWQAVGSPEEIRYEVVLYPTDNPEGQIVATSLTDTSLVLTDLEYETAYYWQVIAQNAQGQRSTSELWNFRTEDFPETVFLYTQRVEGDYEIFSANAERDRIIRLTHQVGYDAFPQFSPSRQWVAYTSQTPEGPQIFVMDKRGKQNYQITQLPVAGYHNFGSGFCWSPDGGQLLYSHYNKLYRINRDGSNLAVVATAPEGRHFKAVDWSGISHKIVVQVVGSDSNQSEIYLMNEDGSNAEQILKDQPGRTECPSFSIDGTQILYTHDVAGFESTTGRQLDAHIFRYHIETQETVEVSLNKPSGTNDLHPRLSPNGAHIIFENTSNEPGAAKSIWIMNSEGDER
ncbi:MAG: carboxypeptidase regulatory-like domain-containing protein, partial [Tunicatimonas sp.]